MRGYLRVFVLKHLEKGMASGYDLMKAYGALSGNKPSSGTMYPLLADLKKKGLVQVTEKNLKKFYALTAKGKRFVSELVQEKKNAMEGITRFMQTVMTKGEITKTQKAIRALIAGNDADLHYQLRESLAAFSTSKHYKARREKYRALLKKTINEIRRLSR